MLEPTPSTKALDFIKLLAHDLRWMMLHALAEGDLRVQELVTLVGEPINLVSYHLKKLRDEAVVHARRSDADGRDIYYSLDLDKFQKLYADAAAALHPGLRLHPAAQFSPSPGSGDEPLRVLFVCTHNSARSQIAEALLRQMSGGQVHAYSAGSHPTTLHPLTLKVLGEMDIPADDLYAKHLDEFAGQRFDAVITVCDQAREVCPVFAGEGVRLHWGFSDPAAIADPEERFRAFTQVAGRLRGRVTHFLNAAYRQNA